MSATPRPFIGDAKSLHVFAALLTAARAADKLHWDVWHDDYKELTDAIEALDTVAPGWREWQP